MPNPPIITSLSPLQLGKPPLVDGAWYLFTEKSFSEKKWKTGFYEHDNFDSGERYLIDTKDCLGWIKLEDK